MPSKAKRFGGRIARRLRDDYGDARLLADDRGQATGQAVNVIVALTVGGLVAAFLLPVALDEIVAVSVTNYSSGAQSLWNILDLIIVLSVFLFFVQLATERSRRT